MPKPVELQRRRPKQARARVTVDSILEAAVQLLERSGADALNTNAVAARAGVSIGTLYQYFPDKDAILVAVARRQLARPGFAALQAALLEALIRALESLLGKTARPPIATRRLRTALKDDAGISFSALERRLWAWLVPVDQRIPARIRRRS